MPSNMFVVCLLLMVDAELLEGRSAFHSRKLQGIAMKSHFRFIKRQSELPECSSDEFLCVNQSRCILDRWVCDGDDDCRDWSDEKDCLTRECPEGYVKCSNGQCLKLTSYCYENIRCRGAANVVSDVECPPLECQSDQLVCTDPARCISQPNICDGYNDCSDGSDEQNCDERVCADDELRCNSGQCVNKSSYCMSNSHCRDFTVFNDACLDFTCPPDDIYFKCRSNGICIANSSRCDGIGDCADRSDETECACAADEFKCNSGQCIKKLAHCVFSYSCGDDTDLSRVCLDFTCPPEFQLFQCQSNGKCIRNGLRCNGMDNCVDGSDETNCPPIQCDAGYASCPTKNKCINKRQFCDTRDDCGDNSDESPAFCSDRECEEDEVKCASGQCVKKDGFCRGEYSCRDESLSPIDTSICTPVQCESGYARCPNFNKCINTQFFCDTDNDCGDNSDEAPELCSDRVCQDDEIACANGQCIPTKGFCREELTCRDNSRSSNDLEICERIDCEPGFGKCPNSNKCINSLFFCNTDNDCGDNSDEEPELCNNRVCDENEVSCENGQCIGIEYFCITNSPCRDSSQSRETHPECLLSQSLPEQEVSYLASSGCRDALQQACASINSELLFDELQDTTNALFKLAQFDLHEICPPARAYYDCILTSFNNSHYCQYLQQRRPDILLETEFESTTLTYVCEENIEVINREKNCLLKLNEQDQPILMFKVMMSCAPQIIAYQSSQLPDKLCIPVELQQCAKNAIAEECGDDIAEVADGLADLAQDFCKEMQLLESLTSTQPAEQPAIPTGMKRHVKGITSRNIQRARIVT